MTGLSITGELYREFVNIVATEPFIKNQMKVDGSQS
jgi:hypothetical protein